MDAITTVREDLKPEFTHLIEYLNDSGQLEASTFFTELLIKLVSAQDEEALLSFFLDLSTTAFVGLTFDDQAAQLIDDLLAHSMQITETFSASTDHPH
ncbi:MAG: hypothetical protein AAF513_09535 [Pseudomonadota bacterium]